MSILLRRREFTLLGAAAAWPLVARAQQQALPVVGVLDFGSESTSGLRWRVATRTAFLRGLGEQGYVEGRNFAMLYRWGEYRTDRLPALAQDLVARKVSVVYAISAIAALVAKRATSTIPIVFGIGEDPVALDFVRSLNRPGGNITGVTFLSAELIGKRLEMLHEAAPAATTIAFLVNPNSGVDVFRRVPDAEAAARILGVRLLRLNAASAKEIELAFTGAPNSR